MNWKGATIWGTIFSLRAVPMVFIVGESLTPDTSEYARGAASWSSPVGALAGYTFGLTGVRVFGVIGAVLLGALVGGYSRRWWMPALVFLSPPGWYAMQASADAAGSMAMGVAIRSRDSWAWIPVCAFHLEAGLCCGLAFLVRRMGFQVRYIGLVGGLIACIAEYHFQVRYFLPGVVGWAVI